VVIATCPRASHSIRGCLEICTRSLIDTIPTHAGNSVKTKELSALQERLAKLEHAIRGGEAPRAAASKQPVKDASGRRWTCYFRNDDGVEWFLEEASLQSAPSAITVWRKRAFPDWALQRDIVTMDEIDCRGVRYRTHELRVTQRDGTTQESRTVTPWTNIFPSSAEKYLMSEYCR
jgi:hypothetical protein